ncbi:mastermind-like protein 2 [Rhinatrema bivittatum]|uniref:mastermind-like protein 2 n=1 Tax=Rhinatrema bivittatum TaxID=194408 RepID=UPI00112C8430|nr:mastermind-like protein 2 [Rhinatrema bivittatum]XP_029458242.1 mastermind-like protein 2 [Rhinatrema bivittatum]
MGDTAPLQAPSAGLGVRAPGLLGGGSVAPQVHSAIVERLRARITVCRQHHLNCQGRYERSRAENSDRERESTLQLLNLAQHGQSTRKNTKHSKAGAVPPPDYPQPKHQRPLNTEGSGINGELQLRTAPAPGDQRSSTLIALQGSLKRKLVVSLSPTSESPNGVSDSSFLDVKRMRLNDHLSIGQSEQHVNNRQSQPRVIPMGQGLQRKTNNITSNTHGSGNEIFNMTLKDIKKEPGETMSCSKHLDGHLTQENMFPNRYDDMIEQMIDPELQELFNELTSMSVSPMSDLELQNMINITIKQDEPFSIDLGQQNQGNTPRSSLPMEKIVIKNEYSPGLNQTPVGSPQMRPSSAGPAFSMSNAVISTSSPVTSVPQTPTPLQVSSNSNCPLPGWQEISHAEQLKQIAANRQQHTMIQQHQQNQSSNWATLSTSGPPPRPFGQEKISSPSFPQQQFNPQSSATSALPINGSQAKGMNNYLYKPNSSPQSNHIHVMMQQKAQDLNRGFMNNTYTPLEQQHHNNIKPLFHFNSEGKKQPMPSVLSSQSKPILHYAQQQHPPQPLLNQPLQRPPHVPLPMQQKMMLQKLQQSQQLSGLQYPVLQHRQDQHCVGSQSTSPNSTAGACANPNSGSGYMNNSQQSVLNQQLEKKQVLQKQMMEQKQQLLIQQQLLAESDKSAQQEQLNRHLTRPPPDYKDQRRNLVNMQPTNQYSGGSQAGSLNANQTLTNPVSTHNIVPSNSGLLSTNHGTRVPSVPGVRNMEIYGNLAYNQSVYSVAPGVNQMQQPNTQTQIGSSQNNATLSRKESNTAPFGTGSTSNSQQVRSSLNHGAGQRASNVIINSDPPSQNWTPPETTKQNTLKPASVRVPTNATYSNQSLQLPGGNQHFPQGAMAPPSHLTPRVQIRPSNPMNQVLHGQTVGSLRGVPSRPSQLRAQTVPGMNPLVTNIIQPATMPSNGFTPAGQNPRPFPGTDHSNDLGFDFLSQQSDSLGSTLNTDSDFIDCLLKTGPSSDDWMKDINLDEILGSNS